MRTHHILFLLAIFCLSGCVRTVHDQEPIEVKEDQTPYLILLVEAPHLNTFSNRHLLQSIAKHPSNGNKSGDVGHAWIYLHGWVNGKEITIEGGHSGECGVIQPKYFEGVMNYIHQGIEPNPIKYLLEVQQDGFFQKGSGNHVPTYAVKLALTQLQLQAILHYIHPDNYPYQQYSLVKCQCTTFVVEVAKIAGLKLECELTLPIEQTVKVNGETFILWRDPYYSTLTFASPDILECSLKRVVLEQKAVPALSVYRAKKKWSYKERLDCYFETFVRFPERYFRYLML